MHIKYAAALAIVALVPEVSDHPVWDNAIGDADPTIRGYVIDSGEEDVGLSSDYEDYGEDNQIVKVSPGGWIRSIESWQNNN
ncbi:hypothetical protein TWF106_002561 [Orbilia oligospora]|uniref:Uncharacterized protein n=1 Tax=Orbilia oligospora TaxID=2813651 RepID=A0A6G1M3K8_ORBOL|nr:hypothetical protein TWF106_002561 [Orbilia oligospora]KAF3228074.1 hypothetical protein TWF191_003012 [Orbilia oligospora]KAF3243885.1 hypothetical protein TWF192_007952 [Orbilia oligospora]